MSVMIFRASFLRCTVYASYLTPYDLKWTMLKRPEFSRIQDRYEFNGQ